MNKRELARWCKACFFIVGGCFIAAMLGYRVLVGPHAFTPVRPIMSAEEQLKKELEAAHRRELDHMAMEMGRIVAYLLR